jgi:N-hydroxyarylamine O-acetyltransferase
MTRSWLVVSPPVAPLGDLDAYLSRIGLSDTTTLAAVHRAHLMSIPFENLDSSSGLVVSLDVSDLEEKLVTRRRGGYCFEHNLLFKAALESLGLAPVDMFLARVRHGRSDGPTAQNHLLLGVHDSGQRWLADVGFGGGGLLDPIPFEIGAVSDQAGWRYRIVEDGPEWVLQVFQDGDWSDVYGFVATPVPLVDVEVSNWYTATHPQSPFVTGLVAGRRSPDTCLALFAFEEAVLVERHAGQGASITPVERATLPELLERRFGVPGTAIGPDGRISLASNRS